MRQGDPVSKYNIKGLDIYGHNSLYAAYADDSSFFFKNKESVTEAFKILDEFSFFSKLKPNKETCEVAGIVVNKWVMVALCSVKILGVHYSYNKKLEKNFKNHIQKIETVLKI